MNQSDFRKTYSFWNKLHNHLITQKNPADDQLTCPDQLIPALIHHNILNRIKILPKQKPKLSYIQSIFACDVYQIFTNCCVFSNENRQSRSRIDNFSSETPSRQIELVLQDLMSFRFWVWKNKNKKENYHLFITEFQPSNRMTGLKIV